MQYFLRHGDYDNPCLVSRARPDTEVTSLDMDEGLGHLWFADSDVSISAVSSVGTVCNDIFPIDIFQDLSVHCV